MDLQTYARILRRRWRSTTVVALVVVILAALATLLTAPTYQSSMQFFVSTATSDNNNQLAQGSTFTQARVKSYTQLIKTPAVLSPVIKDLGLTMTPTALANTVTATAAADSVIIAVSVTDASPAGAQRIAQSIATHFPGTAEQLENTTGGSASPVKVTLIQPATPGASPVSPRPMRNLALGLVLGLLAGAGVAVLRHVTDTRIHTADDVQDTAPVTMIGGVPFDADAPEHPLIIQADPHSARAEAFRSVRTNLQFVDAANHPRTIVFTSSLPGEGKTTTVANLALAMAESGAKVCLIEGDLRRPRLLDYLGLEGAVGVTDVLIGRVSLADVLQPFGHAGLTVLGAGALPPNPSELLGSMAMRDLIKQLLNRFDYLLIDAPPLLPVTDAAVISTMVDGAVVVVGSGLVSRDQLRTAVSSLDSVSGRLLGVILNRVPASASGAYHDYRYEYRPQESEELRQRSRRDLQAAGSRARFGVRRDA